MGSAGDERERAVARQNLHALIDHRRRGERPGLRGHELLQQPDQQHVATAVHEHAALLGGLAHALAECEDQLAEAGAPRVFVP
eukprot:scaffold79532_cov53-Phaeocystis_antarctica.AAC.2